MSLFLCAENLRVIFGLRTIFHIENIEIHDNDRIGLVGDNGAGKSTLLSVLQGDIIPDEGLVRRFAGSAIVRQFGEIEQIEEIDSAMQARMRALDTVHHGMSGGELERLRIARALSVRAPLLLVDEPTTNLDFDGVAQVQKALAAHQGALVLISHDRALLDAICTTIWALEDGALRIFPGNYAAYKEQKALDLDYQRTSYAQYRAEQHRLQASMQALSQSSHDVRKAPKRMGNSEARLHKRGKGTTAKKKLDKSVSSLQSRLDQLEVVERPREEATVKMGLQDRNAIRSATAIRAENIHLAIDSRTLLSNANFVLPAGKRTVIVGPNGCGKTTLLRAIRHAADNIHGADNGIHVSPGVTIGWFGQETIDTLDLSKTLLENVMQGSVLAVHETRSLLARMGLLAADMDKPTSVLSGGERAKAALGRLMAGDATLLLMDEPANHLDLHALEALEDMLTSYQGTLLLVSHDHRMIDKVAQRVLVFKEGELVSFEGNLSDYETRQASMADTTALDEDILRMRMSVLASRMSAPKKGDNPEALLAEYDTMAAQLQEMKRKSNGKHSSQ